MSYSNGKSIKNKQGCNKITELKKGSINTPGEAREASADSVKDLHARNIWADQWVERVTASAHRFEKDTATFEEIDFDGPESDVQERLAELYGDKKLGGGEAWDTIFRLQAPDYIDRTALINEVSDEVTRALLVGKRDELGDEDEPFRVAAEAAGIDYDSLKKKDVPKGFEIAARLFAEGRSDPDYEIGPTLDYLKQNKDTIAHVLELKLSTHMPARVEFRTGVKEAADRKTDEHIETVAKPFAKEHSGLLRDTAIAAAIDAGVYDPNKADWNWTATQREQYQKELGKNDTKNS